MIKKIYKGVIKTLRKNKGFTIMELIMVMVVIGILTGTVGISVDNVNSSVRLSNAVSRALSDIKELKEIAMNEGRTVNITVDSANDTYTLTIDGLSETVHFNEDDYSGIDITSSEFGGALSFDVTGMPTDGGSSYGGERIIMNVNSGYALIKVYGRSGLVVVEMTDWPQGCAGCGGGC